MLRSDLCDFSDLLLKQTIMSIKEMSLASKNSATFISCISNINNVLIGNAEDLDNVMPMYNLIEHSKNYSKTTGSLWNYYRGELTNNTNYNNNFNKTVVNSNSFKYKTSII